MSTAEYHDESGAEVDEEDVVVIPVPDELSDGTEETWPLNDPRYKYRMIDDSRWRLSLAQMWVEKTGAAEEGMLLLNIAVYLLSVGHLPAASACAPPAAVMVPSKVGLHLSRCLASSLPGQTQISDAPLGS